MKRAGLDYWDKLDVRFYDSLEELGEREKKLWIYHFLGGSIGDLKEKK